jgi:hypothetical protein
MTVNPPVEPTKPKQYTAHMSTVVVLKNSFAFWICVAQFWPVVYCVYDGTVTGGPGGLGNGGGGA